MIIDLSGTVYEFKDKSKVLNLQDQRINLLECKIEIKVDRQELEKQYEFVTENAPLVYLNDKYENKFYPSSLDFSLQYTQPLNVNGELFMVTKEKLKGPEELLDYFKGQEESQLARCYVIILPNSNYEHSYMQIINGLNVTINYMFYYPYNLGKIGLGNHVGDIEHIFIEFKQGIATRLGLSQHSGGEILEYSDKRIKYRDSHPIVYSAYGSHATYISEGIHNWQMDECGKQKEWRTYDNLTLLFPWDYPHIKSDLMPNISLFTIVRRWGNSEDSVPHNNLNIFGERKYVTGPTGFLDKADIRQIIYIMDQYNYTCQGHDTKRCMWPIGVYSDNNPLCQKGFVFSYFDSTCYILPPNFKFSCTFACNLIESQSNCGPAYQSFCSYISIIQPCNVQCTIQPIKLQLQFTHKICDSNGNWVDIQSNRYQSFNNYYDFKCQYNLY